MFKRIVSYILALVAPRLAREVALDLAADAMSRQADRLVQLRNKANELRAAGNDDLADQLLEQAALLAAADPQLFEPRLPGLPELVSEPVALAPTPLPPPPAPPAPPPAPPALPHNPSPNGNPKRLPGRPDKPRPSGSRTAGS